MRKALGRLWNAMRPGRLHDDLDRELRFHVTERAEELEAGGMNREAAWQAARRQFGNYTTQVERTREMDMAEWLDSTLRNLRLAARGLAKSPGFSITVVLTLALGIGANSAVFSAIDAVLLKPLPFPDADRLVKLGQIDPKSPLGVMAPVRMEDWNRLNHTLQGISGYYAQDSSELSGELPEKLEHALVAPRFLRVLGVSPALGRDFAPEEEHFGGPNAILISDRLWRRRFGGVPGVIGKSLRLGRSLCPIVGVMPASFQFPSSGVDIWSVSANDAPFAQARDLTWYTAIGRLKPGVTPAQARADLAAVQVDLGRQFPKTDARLRVDVQPLKETIVGGVRQSLWIVFGSVSLLLMIACTNIAALLLSRAAGRQHEVSVRFSLGASRSSVAAQLFTEVLLLAVMGAGMGLLLAAAAARVFRVLAKDLPRVEEIGLDWRIVAYALGCAVAATLLCGMIPAIRGTRRSLSGAMAQAGRSHVSSRGGVQFALVGIQVALAVMLLAGAALLLRSFQELGRVGGGFDPEHVLTLHISSSWGETGDPKASQQRMNRMLDGLRSIPGVESAAASYFSLPGVPMRFELPLKVMEGRAESEPPITAESRAVTASYFATVRIPLLSGDLCSEQSGVPTMMVNRMFASTYFNGASVVGHHLGDPGSPYLRPAVVTGIVADARERGLDQPPVPTVYWCLGGMQPGTNVLLRTHGAPTALAETVRRKLHEVEPQRSVYDLLPLTAHISDGFAENRLRTVLLTFFALTAVLLACIGLYGTLSYLVNMRQREVGLRLALGAVRGQILRQFLSQGLRISLLGCAAGIALAAASGRLLAGMLYGVSTWDAAAIGGVIALVTAVSVAASLLPALRASRLEPMRVLRDE